MLTRRAERLVGAAGAAARERGRRARGACRVLAPRNAVGARVVAAMVAGCDEKGEA